MIGRTVEWKYEGRELKGIVQAVSMSGPRFVVLIETETGELEAAEAGDLRFCSPTQPASVTTGSMSYDESEKLIETIRAQGLEDDTTTLDPVGQACRLIEEAMKELGEHTETIKELKAELAKATAKKPKAKKPEPMDEGGE